MRKEGLQKETVILWILETETKTLPLAGADYSHIFLQDAMMLTKFLSLY